jgi:hypothetical protein
MIIIEKPLNSIKHSLSDVSMSKITGGLCNGYSGTCEVFDNCSKYDGQCDSFTNCHIFDAQVEVLREY